MKKSQNPEETKQTMAHVYIAFSVLFFVSLLSSFFSWLFFSFVYCLSALTVFSVPYLIVVLCRTPYPDYMLQSLLSMILIALFYALVAYGLLKKKKVASAVALISSLLTIFANIGFCYISWNGQLLALLGSSVTGIIFNIFLVWVFQGMLRRK